jgi:hypothetical protein
MEHLNLYMTIRYVVIPKGERGKGGGGRGGGKEAKEKGEEAPRVLNIH